MSAAGQYLGPDMYAEAMSNQILAYVENQLKMTVLSELGAAVRASPPPPKQQQQQLGSGGWMHVAFGR